ncbi:alpha/beta fold hydrolase [soil metagenome]
MTDKRAHHGGTLQGPEGAARLPPSGLSGMDSTWSTLVETPHLDGVGRTWHVLDNEAAAPRLTLLCVHGNPTWSYLWRRLFDEAPPDVRVLAVDHLDMGFSERTGETRRLAKRIDDLEALTERLDIIGPVVVVAHDWGGPISLGWAQRTRHTVAGLVLMNTAVHQPPADAAPSLIRLARLPGIRATTCVATPAFIAATLATSRPRLDHETRQGYYAPYHSSARRHGIGAFVADIPLDIHHPSHASLREVADGLTELAATPTLILWGAADPVFSDNHLTDLVTRLPHADVHRFGDGGHLLPERPDATGAIWAWLDSRPPEPAPAPDRSPLWSILEEREGDPEVAVVEMTGAVPPASLTFGQLGADVARTAAGLEMAGVAAGDRVALMVPPGVDLTVCLYACWRLGATVVFVDAGLGAKGISRALASAAPDFMIGVRRALVAGRALRWPGKRILAGELSAPAARALGVITTLDAIRRRGQARPVPSGPGPEALAAVAFTSGATGPAKGVAYRHHQLQAQRDIFVDAYGITTGDRLVAAFAPFALYGPAMGIPSAVPDMDVTAPATLTAQALADAVDEMQATLVFTSPAALRNVLATAGSLGAPDRQALESVRLLLSAGAPVSADLLRQAGRLMPNAEPHTPYGMTEVLPVADISLAEIEEAGRGQGVCVGRPLPTVEVGIAPLDHSGRATGTLTTEAGITGEVVISAPHVKDSYDRLWATQAATSGPGRWHRSGDVGHLDGEGRLWIEGRMVHVVTTAGGPVTPVGIEQAAETIPEIVHAAAVGVGPIGTQQVVAIVVPAAGARSASLAPVDLADRVRKAVTVDLAAVMVVPSLPVDSRHNSKIDRACLAAWAQDVLAGGRPGRI